VPQFPAEKKVVGGGGKMGIPSSFPQKVLTDHHNLRRKNKLNGNNC
jgi:hypothetical protein